MCKIQDLAKGIDLGERIDLILLDLRRHLIRSPKRDYFTKLSTMAPVGRLFVGLGIISRNQRVIVDGKLSHIAPVRSEIPFRAVYLGHSCSFSL